MNNKSFLNPEEIIKGLSVIKKGMKVADFGVGSGYFSLEAAKVVGESGRVYSIDILDSALEAVKGQAFVNKLRNIETVKGDLEVSQGSGLESDSFDVVIMVNILYQTEFKEKVLTEAERILKKGGYVVLIDWGENSVLGPHRDLRLDKTEIRKIAENQGFVFVKNINNVGSYHFGLLFKKNLL